MTEQMESLQPIRGAGRPLRSRLTLKQEFILAGLPTGVVLLVLAFVEAFSHQRLLFASLASSAFLIYLDPQHGTNRVRTLVLSHLIASAIGFTTYRLLGPGYGSAGAAMVATITCMIVADLVHPPAVSTSLAFAFRAGDESNLALFLMAVGITAVLVLLQRASLWVLARCRHGRHCHRTEDGTTRG